MVVVAAPVITGGNLVVQNPPELSQEIQGNTQTKMDDEKNWIQRKKEEMDNYIAQKKEEFETWKLKMQIKFEKVIAFGKTMLMIARFYPIIILVLIILAFFGKPLEYIMLFIAALIVTILYGVVYIFGVDVIRVIPYTLYNAVVYLIPYLAYAILILVVFVLITFFIAILAAINSFGGCIQDWVLCDNSPEAWFKTPSYQYGNRFHRGFFCSKPCMARYAPDGPDGEKCKRIYMYQPSYCPNAEIMRIYSGHSRSDLIPYFLDYNTNDVRYFLKSPHDREAILKEHYLKKNKFNRQCQEAMLPYNELTLNMCSSLDALQKSGKLSATDALKLSKVCKEAYCGIYSTGKGDNYTSKVLNYPFCAGRASSSSLNQSQLIKQVCKVLALIMVFIIILFLCLRLLF